MAQLTKHRRRSRDTQNTAFARLLRRVDRVFQVPPDLRDLGFSLNLIAAYDVAMNDYDRATGGTATGLTTVAAVLENWAYISKVTCKLTKDEQ